MSMNIGFFGWVSAVFTDDTFLLEEDAVDEDDAAWLEDVSCEASLPVKEKKYPL